MTIGWVTLDVGEQALVYDYKGTARIEDGPKRLFLYREKLIPLTRYSANQNEYMVVYYNSGIVEHIKGPGVMYLNPIAHSSIVVRAMESLDANEALVVYKQDDQTKQVTRYVQFGPTLFMPLANEWLHQFRWHGTDPENKTKLIQNSNSFEKLQVIPDQFYYNVDEVRTADDALIRVKLMLFYELKDIETMLNATKDPIADLVNCLCADVIAFVSKYTYIEFMEKSADLNDLKNYPQLTHRSKEIGYCVSKVVFRGYFAHDKLQRLHNSAIETRTNLKIAYEKEEQEQEMTDMKMKNEKDRLDLEQKMEIEELEHKLQLERAQVEHKLMMELKEHEEKIKQIKKEQEATLQGKKAEDTQKIGHLSNLHNLGVKLTEYLELQTPRPEKIVRIMADKNTANFHLHHS